MRPVETALRLIELLGVHQPAGVTQLAQLANLPKSTIQRCLLSLQKAGWIEICDPARAQWTLTMRASIATGGHTTASQQNLRSIAIPVMEDIRRSTKETVHLSYMFENAVVLYERLDGISPVKHFTRVGSVCGLYTTASGKVILAKMPSKKIQEHLARSNKIDSYIGDRALLSPKHNLRQEIQKIKKDGYAISRYTDISAIAAAICDQYDQPFAAITLTAPVERCTPVLLKQWGAMIVDGARRISIGAIALPGVLAL
jgi:IclR family transcriptional regulator, acetate operon repressor